MKQPPISTQPLFNCASCQCTKKKECCKKYKKKGVHCKKCPKI